MKYFIEFQHLPKGAPRPADNGEILPIEITDEAGPDLIPSVGDFVQIDNSTSGGGEHASFSGRPAANNTMLRPVAVLGSA